MNSNLRALALGHPRIFPVLVCLVIGGAMGCNGLTGAGNLVVRGRRGSSSAAGSGTGAGGASGAGSGGSGGAQAATGSPASGPTGSGAGSGATTAAAGPGAGATTSSGAGTGGSPATTTGPSATVATSAGAGGSPATTTGAGPTTSAATTGTGGGNDPAQLCVDTINMYRATLNLAPFARWNGDEMCTSGQAQADSISGTPHSAFGQCAESAQNECPGWPGPPGGMIQQCMAQMWAEGPGADFHAHGHYINMSSTQYTKVSCGYYTLADGSVWATQDFQ